MITWTKAEMKATHVNFGGAKFPVIEFCVNVIKIFI